MLDTLIKCWSLIDLVMTYLQQVNSERQEKLRKALEEAALAKKIRGGWPWKTMDVTMKHVDLPWVYREFSMKHLEVDLQKIRSELAKAVVVSY